MSIYKQIITELEVKICEISGFLHNAEIIIHDDESFEVNHSNYVPARCPEITLESAEEITTIPVDWAFLFEPVEKPRFTTLLLLTGWAK